MLHLRGREHEHSLLPGRGHLPGGLRLLLIHKYGHLDFLCSVQVFVPSGVIHLGSLLGLPEDLEGQLLKERVLCPVGKSEEPQSLKGSENCTWEDWGQQKSRFWEEFLEAGAWGEP